MAETISVKRAIILAAGMGKRLQEYSKVRPKCLLEVGGLSILRRQVLAYYGEGVRDLVAVKGYLRSQVRLKGIRYYSNPDYASTNMVHSLFCATRELQKDLVISYGDVLFESRVLRALLSAPPNDISVVVDTQWKEYYRERFSRPYEEAESLILGADDRVYEIGESRPLPKDVHGQYIGLIRLSRGGCEVFKTHYSRARSKYWNKKWLRGRVFQKAYMTDFLQALIDEGVPVYAVPVKHGWLEFDRARDYEKVVKWHAESKLYRFCRID